MIERCGDRQRKFDGLDKWPFRMCMESLPIMLQIALLLLTCGLSRYVWSVNVSVGRVVISFTVLGVLFYIAVVVAGTSSYECPFQTPVSIGLRHLKDSEATRKLLASLFPQWVISFTRATWKNTQQALVSAIRGVATKVGHRTIIILLRIDRAFLNAKQRLGQGIQRFRHAGLPPTTTQDTRRLPSRVRSGIRNMATKVGHQTIILLLRIDRVVGNTKQRLTQGFRHAGLLPTTLQDTHHQPLVSKNGPGLRVRVWNLEALRRQNMDNARCVSWALRNITDPEAIDSDIRLAGTIRWFYNNSNHDPPFDLIVSAFEECFDATKQLYPGTRDRVYFSARAILQINMRARTQSHKLASKYPIPAVSSNSVQHIQHSDPDLYHIICMLEWNIGHGNPTLNFPGGTNTHTHSLWMSTLFVDLTHVDPNPILTSYKSYLSMATDDHQALIANTLLMWYMFLGGHVEEETFWAVDKSYVVVLLSLPSSSIFIIVYASDSLQVIITHLSARVVNVIADGNGLQHLNLLLEFLAAWENRPVYLTPMAYQWCSVISESAGRLEVGEVPTNPPPNLPGPQYQLLFKLRRKPQGQPRRWRRYSVSTACKSDFYPRLQPQDPNYSNSFSNLAEEEFSHVGLGCDLVCIGDTSHRTCQCPPNLIPLRRVVLLPIILDVGFRLAKPGCISALHLNNPSHDEWLFKVAFSSNDDEVIADAMTVWIIGGGQGPFRSFVPYFANRPKSSGLFSPRLQQVVLDAIGLIQHNVFEASELETIHLLNCLNVGIDDMADKGGWLQLLAGAVCLPAGLDNLSPHYWCLLDKFALGTNFSVSLRLQSVELMRSLEEAEDWEKLEVWIVVVWQSLGHFTPYITVQDVVQVTHKLSLQRPSTLQRLKDLHNQGSICIFHKPDLWRIYKQVQKEQLPLQSPLPL
jgi:hypothetical protein